MTTTATRLQDAGRHVTPLLVLRLLLVAVLLNAGIGKYAGAAGPVETFAQVGLGQWFRYAIATIEVVSAIGLLVTPWVGLAAVSAASVLVGAVLMEILVLDDGNPLVPTVVLMLLAVVAWQYRARTSAALAPLFEARSRRGA